MKLKHITFTGVDERTSPYVLESIQQEFPYVEFGILMSRHWVEQQRRLNIKREKIFGRLDLSRDKREELVEELKRYRYENRKSRPSDSL